MSRYLVTDENANGHLPVRDSDDGPLNHHLMGAAWAALHGGYRGNKYQGPDKEKAIAKLKALYKSEGMELPSVEMGFGVRGSGFGAESASFPGSRIPNPETRHLAVLLNGPGRPMRSADPASGSATRYEIPICVTGTWVKNGHKFSITPQDLAAMVKNFEKRKNDQVVIDYEHASENPDVARGGAIPAAGWIHEVQVEKSKSRKVKESNGSDSSTFDSLTVLTALVEWTPEAEALIKGGQYRFFSPAIDWNFADKETGESQGATLTSGALTNHPFLEELPPIMLSDLSADVSTGYLDAPLETVSVAYPRQGAGMKVELKASSPKVRSVAHSTYNSLAANRTSASVLKAKADKALQKGDHETAAGIHTGLQAYKKYPDNEDDGHDHIDSVVDAGGHFVTIDDQPVFVKATETAGGKMKSKKLSVKKMTGDDFEGAQGHHGIFDGDDYMGHVHNDDLRDHVKKNMDDFDDLLVPDKDSRAKGQAGVKGHQEPDDADDDKKMSELLRESGISNLKSGIAAREQVREALKLASTHQLVEQREASRTLLLTECCGTGVSPVDHGRDGHATFNTEKAKRLLRENKISAADLLDAIEAKGLLDEAISKGKILPKDRAFFFEIAFNQPKKFAEYIAGAVPVIRLGTVGLGDTQQLPVDQEVDIETKKLMSEKKLGYGKAMKEVLRANPQLEDRYRAAHRQEVRSDSPAAERREGGNSGITQ